MIRARKRKIRKTGRAEHAVFERGRASRKIDKIDKIDKRGSMLAAELSTGAVERLNDQDSTSPPLSLSSLRSPFERGEAGSPREPLERFCERKGGALLTFH